MGFFNIRSLLLAAIVLSSCITWTASRHHYTHNVAGHRSRHRRQGAGQFLPTSFVLPGGVGSGAWGDWGDLSPCSRTCGGGVASQKRICLEVGPDGQPLCTGGDTKYVSCETQDCPAGSVDFRVQQCAEYNNELFRGVKYNWVPYKKAPNPCELNCMPRGERFYYRHKSKVIDGTRCNDESFDVCVNGTCEPVGCDMMLGSSAREDKCRECRGDNNNCHTITGLLDTQDLRKGYNDVLLIPQGATTIIIYEIKPSNNYLALRGKENNKYYLNGEYHIDFPRSLNIAGALWHYERSQQGFPAPDKLRCQGPTTEPLYLSLLLQDENVGIQYEYSIPTELMPPPNQEYIWTHDKYSECTASCGGGIQMRNVTCRSRDTLELVDESLCDEALKLANNQTCNSQPCAARWVEGPWSPCSKLCGEGGTRSREVHCEKIITNLFPSIVADSECEILGPKPHSHEECNKQAACPSWFTGPWKECDKLCDEGKQRRQVVCITKSDDGRVEVLDDEDCDDEKPEDEQPCIKHPCQGVDWVLSEWTGCDTCVSTIRTRIAECVSAKREVVNASFCAYHPPPVLEEKCDRTKLPACEVQWYATQWSKCSANCGKGVQTRRVFCGLFDGESVLKVDDDRCDKSLKYNDSKPCEVPKEKCPAKWYTSSWTECSKKCGGGEQTRYVLCLINNTEVTDCNEKTMPDSTQVCNKQACNEDDLVPVDVKSTPIMDDYDYEECEEDEEYPEVGIDLDTSSTLDMMFSDSPSTSEGSGTGSTTFGELESEWTTDTGSGMETTLTDSFGSGATDVSLIDENTDGASTFTDVTDTTLSTASEETYATDKSTDLSSATSSVSSDSTTESSSELTSSTLETDSSEASTTASVSGATDESTPSGATDETSETSATDTTGDTISTESSASTDGAFASTVLSSSVDDTSDSSTSSESTDKSSDVTTESGATTESTDSSVTDESTDNSSTTEATESSPTDETTESSSTSEFTESSPTIESSDSTTSSDFSGSTDSSTTVSSDVTSSTGLSESESGSTESSLSTDITGLSTDSSGSTTESTEFSTTESSSSGGSTESSTISESSSEESSTISTEYSTVESTESSISASTDGSSEGSTTEVSGSTVEFTETSTGGTEVSTSSSEISGSTTETTEGATESSTAFSGSTETTLEFSETTESGTEASSTFSGTTEETSETESSTGISTMESVTELEETTKTTTWTWASTVNAFSKPRKCRPKKRPSKCHKSKFGCCPDKKTPATGPFDKGCPNPKTCNETKFGCCPDGVSPAAGKHDEGCPIEPCKDTLFGCCKSDNITAAEGNDQEGCPPPCKASEYGCCRDGETQATGPYRQGCPETATTIAPTTAGPCDSSKFGCCYDNITEAKGPDGEGCPCNATEFGCCPDGISPALDEQMEGCAKTCNSSTYGCCPDGETPAHGPELEGCCLLYPYGCCPDNYKPAEGPHLEGCGCTYTHYGCCPDQITIARGPGFEGCGCEYTDHGCCPDKHTPATGPKFEGCSCHTYQFGCCPDGVTIVKGPNMQGCNCQQSEFGCCGDEETPATGPGMAGCDCSNSRYGCCPDGVTEAKGPKFLNCTDIPEDRQASCSLATDRGSCRNFSVAWFYDMEYGGCSRFWYGGCEGNGNRFASEQECKDVCVHPTPKEACNLPKVKGSCDGYNLHWYYDTDREQCGQFIYGGCLGNANNFLTRELCQEQCEPPRTEDQCTLPIEAGSCAGNFNRWGFNPDTSKCEEFIWGGCEGNTNRFNTEAACMARCAPPGAPKPRCMQPEEKGNCTEKVPAWSFSQTENRCVPFYYSGCGGNENNFETEEECAEICPSAYVPDICVLPAVTGECAEYTERWFFDTSIQSCRQFYYGGCGGNANNFASQQECERSCTEERTTVKPQTTTVEPFRQDFCFLEMETGPCTQAEVRWWYDSAHGVCKAFEYGGCGGNRNNFLTQQHCEQLCLSTQDICQLPMQTGPCEGSVMQWFYDASTDSCSQFTYGGCEGNGNRFATLENCEKRCRRGPSEVTTATPTTTVFPLPTECHVDPDLEECNTVGRVWFYEPVRHECLPHDNMASGRGCRYIGTFYSQEACERSCGVFRNIEVCRYPVDPGPCTTFETKFYYDDVSGRCQQFTYGGCQGGPNRFSTVDECESVCRPPSDPCTQPAEIGNCLEYFVKWYYDAGRDECNQFVYGGCGGNDNKFDSREDCEGRCKRAPPEPFFTTTTTSTAAPIAITTATAAPVTSTTVAPFITSPREPVEEECRTPDYLYPCGASVEVFYYDSERRQCVRSDIGACGHLNSYRTEEECERRCGAFRGLDPCASPLEPGPCRAAITKYYFDSVSGQCLSFAYGGCRGGPNRFSTEDECKDVCGARGPAPACLQAADSGVTCSAPPSRRWYYSQPHADCIAFVYSGCGGSDNNFLTYDQCADLCTLKPLGPDENEIVPQPAPTTSPAPPPDCSAFAQECAALRCEFGVQRTRTAAGCERCSCVRVEVDCAPLAQECDRLECYYGMERTMGDDGCERCKCIEHPCAGKNCPEGERCIPLAHRDVASGDVQYSSECRTVNKAGSCPAGEPLVADGACRRECNDDADCRDNNKCCLQGCSNLCLPPESDTTTTYAPEVPQAPRANTVDTPPEVTAAEGGKATLRCLFHGNPPPRITWRRGELTIDGDIGKYRLLSDGALEIVSLFRNDSGVYICVADNELGTARQEINLQVNDPVTSPMLIAGEPNTEVTGTLGRPLEVRCLAYGYPEPMIFWYRGGRDGSMIPYSSTLYEARENVLRIKMLKEETLGEYTCQAYNGVGKPATWSVLVSARQPDVVIDERMTYVTPRQPVVYTTRQAYIESTTATAAVPDIIIPMYTVPTRTRITVDPPTLTAGARLSLPCEVEGHPPPEVTWTKDSVPLVPSDRIHITDARLTIQAVTTNDTGVYGCHANNAFSSDYSIVQVTVQALVIPDKCTDNPFFARCDLIVTSKFCNHKYYSRFCCKSCVEAGQLDPMAVVTDSPVKH